MLSQFGPPPRFGLGYRASWNPYASAPSGAEEMTAAPGDVILGRFGWADPSNGQVSNLYTPGARLGWVCPTRGTWGRVYWNGFAWVLRQGLGCVLALIGDFHARFCNGSTVGQAVYADPITGQPYSGNVTGSAILTPWTVVTQAYAGDWAVISALTPPLTL